MDREDTVIELGTASVETQGQGVLPGDEKIGFQAAGLSDD